MELTPGPLYYGSNGYEIKEDWNHDSYNSIYGKTEGSAYFNFIELGQLFESSVFSTSDGDIEKVLDPLDGWRIPTKAEWASIMGTTRSGSTVNGASNIHYAMIQLTGVTHAGSSSPSGWLIFPDGETITGAALSNMDNTTSNTGITASQLDNYLEQGCVFLPGSGFYEGGWGNGLYYWSSTENSLSTGYVSTGDNKNKDSCYFPVYLVKDAADEATRLIRTWTYTNENIEVELPYSVNAIKCDKDRFKKGTFTFTTEVKIKESQPTYLWFQHADQSAEVYVDNTLVEKHWGGYNAFFVDLSDHVHVGTNNIKVALNNNEGKHLAPYDGDFNFNATLGEVKLISSPVVPSPDYGYDGFHITSTVSAASATITVKTKVPTGATLTCSIKGENCNYSNTQTSIGEEITFTTTINNPHLWNGTLDPYLYDVTLTVAKDGVVYHTFKRGYGLRFYRYVINETVGNETYTGFLLNGSPCRLRGVCMHNDLEGKANALTAEDIDNDFELLKELGCNFVRLAHYPHPKEVYDWCDKLGIIVQTEAPWVNKAESDCPSDYYTHLVGQYKDMVNQHYNHPCILFWGLANEIKPNDKPFTKEKIEQYASLIKSLDSERLVGFVMSHSYNSPTSFNSPNVDWFGCNDYVGWYVEKESNNPTSRLNTRKTNFITNAHKPFALSEYGCGGTQSCHSDDFKNTTIKGTSTTTIECDRHDIEYLMWLHEGHVAAIRNFPELMFTSVWQLFDIAVAGRHEGYKVSLDGETTFDNNELKYLNNKGLVERDHRTKKDPFYLYKAWWNENNDNNRFVHICGKDYEKLTDRVIKCYTNDGSTLTLYVNNVYVKTATVVDNIATFTATTFQPGDVIRVNGATSNDTFTFTDYSENYVFITNGNWNNAANWSPTVPAAARNVTINAACTVPKEYTAKINNITIGGNGSLTIADGGQLYHNNEGVTATVKKDVAAYTVSQNQGDDLTDGWYFIASPVTDGYAPTGSMVQNTYDLYRFNPTTESWENFKNTEEHPDFTTLSNGKGYLYANSNDVTLSFTGTIKSYDATYTVGGTGWNLVGNPYTFNTYVNQPHYTLNDTRDAIVAATSNSEAIAPCTGVIVEGDVTFYKEAASQSNSNGYIQLVVAQQATNRSTSATLDNAIVTFNEGSQLEKFYFMEQNANLYIPQGAEEYAIAFSEGVGEMPLNFKANKNDEYTISVNPEGVEMAYLHLIDNMTGADVDLLVEPNYTFTARTTDYESRFRLVFSAIGNENDNENFAFISNGEIIINGIDGNSVLQIIDITGRVIASYNATNRISTNGMTAGVYVLRLIGNETKTQKIVVR